MVTSGVPQGSGLGPILLLIYINDMDDKIMNQLLKFADDTKIFSRIRTDEEKLQKDLDTLLTVVCRAVLPSTASPGGGWGSGL